MATIRQAKVGEMIKRELAELLQKEMRDPRLNMVSVTEVEVARDMTVAKVFISTLGTPEERKEALKALSGASGFLRGHLGRVTDMKTIPALMFRYDTGIERGTRMFELLREEQAALADNEKTAALAAPPDDTIGADAMTEGSDASETPVEKPIVESIP